MQSELQSAQTFLKDEAKAKLNELSSDAKAKWGIMTPQHMLEHLIVTFKMSIGRIQLPVISKEEDLPRLKQYLMKDSPMRRNVPSPTGKNELQPLRFLSLDAAREKLFTEIDAFIDYMEANPDTLANHPYGGPMTAQEWLLFHRKHFKHHMIQFGLIDDYEKK